MTGEDLPVEAFGFPAVGYCIYCGTKDRRLTKEHVVGKAIGGNVTLDKCSCSAPVGVKSKKRCSEITRDVEQFCFRKILGHFRQREGFPTTERHSSLPLHIINSDGEMDIRRVNLADHPGMMAVPVFPTPGILINRQQEPEMSVWSYTPNPDAIKKFPDGTRIGRLEIHGRTYARMLAKIAHAWAAARQSLGDIEFPFLPDFILGRDGIISTGYYVGCINRDLPNEPTLHRVKLVNVMSPDGREFLAANIRLFANYGAPEYHVVIGRLKPNA